MAKRHVAELDREIRAFFDTTPYAHTVEIDVDTGEEIHKHKLIKRMPFTISGIARDIVLNLRAALDQACYTVAVASGKRGKCCAFPFADSAANFDGVVKRNSKELPKEIVDLVRGFKPYKGGDDLLWALNPLSNTNKHAITAPAATKAGGIFIENMSFTGGGPLIRVPVWDRTKNEMELFRIRPTARGEANFKITNFIAIYGVEAVDGQPVVTLLNLLTGKVEGVVMAIEAESKRIGLL